MDFETTPSNGLIASLEYFAYNIDDPTANFDLATEYEMIGNTSSALTHYLRAAERTEDELLAYEALVCASVCISLQGDRGFTQSHLLKQAICVMPERPEAYFFLCKYYESKKENYDCYFLANIALGMCDFSFSIFDTYPNCYNYLGRDGIELCKAVSGIHWEKLEESKEIFSRLSEESSWPEVRSLCKSNLDALGF